MDEISGGMCIWFGALELLWGAIFSARMGEMFDLGCGYAMEVWRYVTCMIAIPPLGAVNDRWEVRHIAARNQIHTSHSLVHVPCNLINNNNHHLHLTVLGYRDIFYNIHMIHCTNTPHHITHHSSPSVSSSDPTRPDPIQLQLMEA